MEYEKDKYGLHELTKQELACMERLNESLAQYTPKEMERCRQKIDAFIENNEELFAKLDEWSKSEEWGLLRLPE